MILTCNGNNMFQLIIRNTCIMERLVVVHRYRARVITLRGSLTIVSLFLLVQRVIIKGEREGRG